MRRGRAGRQDVVQVWARHSAHSEFWPAEILGIDDVGTVHIRFVGWDAGHDIKITEQDRNELMRIPAPRFPVESVVSTAPTSPASAATVEPAAAPPPAAPPPAAPEATPPAARPTLFEAGTVRASEDGSRWRVTNDTQYRGGGQLRARWQLVEPGAGSPRERAPPPPAAEAVEAADSGALARLATAAAAAAAALEAAGQAPSDSSKPPIAGLPPGWSRIMNFGKCQGYRGPAGQRVQSRPAAWREHQEIQENLARVEAAADAAAELVATEPPTEPATPKPAPMTAAEMHAAAAAEGLTLVRSENSAGFKGVSHDPKRASKPFHANLRHGGRSNHLGTFATAEEAALAVARFLGPEGGAAAPTPPTPEPAAERLKFQRIS